MKLILTFLTIVAGIITLWACVTRAGFSTKLSSLAMTRVPTTMSTIPSGYVTMTGVLQVAIDDRDTNNPSPISFFLDDGKTRIPLNIPSSVVIPRNAKYVKISGRFRQVSLPTVPNSSELEVQSIQIDFVKQSAGASATGSDRRPIAVLLCRYSNIGLTPHPVAWYEKALSNVYPGIDHFWRENSYNQITFAGSIVRGWYDLPEPKDHYDTGHDHDRALNCITTATADLDYTSFKGIVTIFNDEAGGSGGVTITSSIANRDGVIIDSVPIIIMYGRFAQEVLAHELGHAIGYWVNGGNFGDTFIRHSSGPYNRVYDSYWDTESYGSRVGSCPHQEPPFDCVVVGLISYSKDELGWIYPGFKVVVPTGTPVTVSIQHLDKPQLTPTPGATLPYLMAQVPISGSGQFYTIEARLHIGYDVDVPGETILIHRVDPSLADRRAQVVDIDIRQGNTGHFCLNGIDPTQNPNDGGAMWLVGQTFVDDTNGISIAVNSFNANTQSFNVTISNNGGTPSPMPTFCVTRTPTSTSTNTPTNTQTPTNTRTLTPTSTPSPTSTSTRTATP